MSDNIKVVVKVRPLIFREIEDKHSYQWRINNNTLYQIDQNGKDCGPSFTFDKVYDTETRTHDVYNDIAKPIVEAATAGFNGTIFAYGQTSSGKTYTMTGTDDAPGIIPLAVLNLFDIIRSIPDRDFLVRVSYVEIYNESFIDLLDLTKKVKIQETLQGIRVCTTEKLTISPDEVLDLMRQGKANRQTGSTNMNEESSRSHSIFQITIESREHIEGEQEVGSVNVSQLNLVDLAGSERSGQTGATGIRFKEGTHINKSLSSLALVIKQLSEDPNKHVNYRDSKLTRILQNSLGGNAKTSIICAVTPAAVEETISTLQFANRAKAIKNTPAVNLVTTNATMIQSLTKQLSSLKTQLESKKNVEQDNYNLQKQIANLQKMILNGFGQNRNTDIISTARRKLIQPRRVTISTLHPIQEDPMPLVPKFCTPSLKYNPMSVGVAAAAAVQSASSAPAIVHCDVIEIDSDDENTSDIYPCSPYHDCYNKSKTPPCVLRKNAKQAEKNLMEIIELTEREKIYTPNVVELMEQLEHKSLALTNLQENITNLHSKLKDKDQEVEMLKSNITEAQEEIESLASVKAQLETTCNSYSTKITDLEVSFETLKKKSKSREDELLTLLKEHEDKKKNEAIGKLSSKAVEKELKNFMDLSRDISLVNSSIENSVIETEMKQNCCDDTKSQVTLRDQTILQLEANLHAQKLKIDNIESINEKLQVTVSSLNDKLSLLETENTNLKYSMESLNKTISSQKSLIDIANTDIESYCSAIRELKIKLHQKENVMTDISDTDIETMIANEEMFIANNENMKNIIQSLKIALDLRNKEINKLKTDLDNNQNLSSVEEFDSMKNEISSLTNEVERLKNEVTDNVSVIDTLLQEKNKMINVEKQLTLKFTEIQEQKDLLDKEIEIHKDEMAKLKDSNIKLTEEVKAKQEEIISVNKENDNKNKDLSQKIVKLEAVIKNKESIIASLKKEQNGTRENIEKAKLGLTRIQNIITLLSGDINVLPEFIDDLVVAFSTLGDSLTSLENIAKDTIKEKEDVIAKLEQREIELNTLHTKINGLGETVDEFYNEYETLMLDPINRDDFVNSDMNAFDKLIHKINNLLSIIKSTQIALNQTIRDKNAEISESKIKYENKSKELSEESQKNNIQKQQISDLTSNQSLILNNIFEKATNLTSKFCIENNISCHHENVSQNMYEQVILTMDKIDNYISLLQSEHLKCDNIEHVFGDAENKIQQLTEENLKLIQDISELKTSKAILSDEILEVQEESKNLRNDLQSTNDLLNQLRQHLSTKASEIEIIENKAKSWKDSFTDLESMMQNKINLLEADNLKLKSKCSELEMQDLPKCYDNEENFASGDQECNSRKQHYIQVNSPPSLLTICCNRIADAIDFNDDKSVTSSSSFTELSESKMSTNKCNCKDLLADLQNLVEEKNKLNMIIERLQNENEDLLKEREDVQKEVQLLLEHSYELQKRVVNHRTILSTLTATTYAENKSLSSQIKFLQHHHSRFHHVCQKVIPTFKKQLYDLMTLLKSECLGKHNESFKRYSLPNALDTSSLHSTFKNESIFDNDLLMLDTNVTLTTCDNTMTAHDQTCFDVTQVWVSNEVACQTNFSEVTKDSLYSQICLESLDENKILETLESLKTENDKLRDLVDNFTKNKSKVLVSTLSSPIKFPCTTEKSCKQCDQYVDDIRISNDSHKNEMDAMSKKLSDLECEKNAISEKCRNLALEVPSSEALVRRFSALEEELQIKLKEIERLTVLLSKTNKTLKSLQEENESLSNELMENISEIDVLKSEQDTLKETNTKLSEKLSVLGKELKSFESEKKHKPICNNCALKDEIINSLEKRLSATESHSKLDRSYSDADSSSRYNKICTLQNELHAGKEDCIELKEEVTTIKKHLEHSNLSISQNMDLDESVIDSQMYSFNKDFGNASENKFNLSNVQEKRVIDLYISDKTDCLSYYCEKTGADKESLGDFKILEVMKMLYVNFSTKHANEIQNLVNKLKDLEEAKSEYNLQAQLNKLEEEQKAVLKDLKEKDGYVQKLAEIVSHIKNNISLINEELDSEDALIVFRTNFLRILDTELGLTSSNIFESIIQQLNKKYNEVIDRNNAEIEQLKDTTERMDNELKSVTDNLLSLRSQLSEKESEFELLQRQKEKMHEISKAVTIDIIRKEKELRSQLTHYYQKLINSNFIKEDMDLSLNESLNKLFSFLLNQLENKESEEKEKLNIVSEIENLKTSLLQKDEELKLLSENFNRIVTENEQKLFTQTSLHNDLNKIYAKKVEENEINANAINKLTEEINILKNNVSSKEALINSLETKHSKDLLERQSEQIQMLKKLQNVEKELEDLKSINQHILMEKQACAIELESVSNILNQKNLEIDKFVAEIDKLKQSLHESSQVIENLKIKSNTLLQEKCSNCVRLETNIKTHEKTAAIQITIINRLQEQKADFVKSNGEKDKQIETITQKCKSLEEECLKHTKEIQKAKEEIETLSSSKQILELRISELEMLDVKPRLSIDSVAGTARRRRQSIHDSKRIFADDVQGTMKSRSKTDDLFMDVDEDSSSRSTPIRLSRGRDSLLSKHDQSDKDEEQSRPGSAAATRRRRRTAHDTRRGTENSFESSGSLDGEAAHLRTLLSVCQEELEELKRRYKEVDEECETCAQYLKERDEQCLRLKKEKIVLEKTIMDLREKMNSNNSTSTKATFTDASVNTEEDWTNLHSVFVDRMSYDAEVEKNKKLIRTIEELRFKKQDLKNTMTKMQKALDKKVNTENSSSQALESTKLELATCRQELEELKERYKELDEECETCAEYLRESDEQCQKLKEAKAVLEVSVVCQEELEKLKQRYKELDEECETCAQYLRERDEQCLRLKREKVVLEKTIMDLREKMNSNNSTSTKATFTDASVNTEEDWTNLHSVFVDRMSYDAEVEKNKKLIRTIEELRFKKQDLKNTMTKMQKALDKKVNTENSSSQALESTKLELATCRQELEELKERYKELDEECETCAEYLRERDEQCQKLKEAKTVLESKLEEYQQSSIVHSVRKRRQTLHDQNRRTSGGVDATTETSDDLLSYQVERDDSKIKLDEGKEIKRLKMVVDKLSQHKASLEQQLTSVGTQYVATGSAIVQNQQLSDVMKENQKLKKINAKLVTICKKRGKSLIDSNIENEDPSQKN